MKILFWGLSRATYEGGIMATTGETVTREFQVWMTATLGLLKDGKMGASQARADRIKTAVAYTKRRSVAIVSVLISAGVSSPT